jgi:hypothetical protein
MPNFSEVIHGFFEDNDISTFIKWMEDIVADFNWLFVAIDSGRGLELDRLAISKVMNGLQINHIWRPEGLWIHGIEMRRIDAMQEVIVPFSAAYIFDKGICISEVPLYSNTSETEQFDKQVSETLILEMQRLNAKAYIADGQGLNYIVLDERISNIVRSKIT